MQTLFRSLELYGSSLDETLWTAVIDEIINPLLDSLASFSSPSITISSETAAEDEEEDEIDPLSQPPPRAVDSSKWHESHTLALQSTGSIFSSFFLSSLSSLPNATQIWSAYLAHLESSFTSGVPSVAHASTSAFLKILSAWEDSSSAPSVLTSEMMRSAWESWEKMGEAVVVGSSTNISSSASPSATSTTESFTQETLRTLVLTLKPLLALSPSLWSTDRLRQVLTIIKAVLTHPPGDEIRPDVDNPTPLQAAIFDIFPLFDLSPSGAAAALLQDLSSLITLAYASTFDEETGRGGGAAPAARRITFVAVSKRAMKMSVEVFEARKGEMDIFEKGAAEELIKAFSLPVSPCLSLLKPLSQTDRGCYVLDIADQAQVRLSPIVSVRLRTSSLEDGDRPLPADRQAYLLHARLGRSSFVLLSRLSFPLRPQSATTDDFAHLFLNSSVIARDLPSHL
jgi:hypothetical protein